MLVEDFLPGTEGAQFRKGITTEVDISRVPFWDDFWHASDIAMSITIQIDLPESLAREARAKGLLESECVTELISTELRRQKAAADLDQALETIRSQAGEPMTLEEIQAEIYLVRTEGRMREAGR